MVVSSHVSEVSGPSKIRKASYIKRDRQACSSFMSSIVLEHVELL